MSPARKKAANGPKLSAIMRKTGTREDYRRRKITIRHVVGKEIPPQQWPTALIVCPKSLIFNVSAVTRPVLTTQWARELDTVSRESESILTPVGLLRVCDLVDEHKSRSFEEDEAGLP